MTKSFGIRFQVSAATAVTRDVAGLGVAGVIAAGQGMRYAVNQGASSPARKGRTAKNGRNAEEDDEFDEEVHMCSSQFPYFVYWLKIRNAMDKHLKCAAHFSYLDTFNFNLCWAVGAASRERSQEVLQENGRRVRAFTNERRR